MTDATQQHVTHEKWFLMEVAKGEKAADEGRVVGHGYIKAKWKSKMCSSIIEKKFSNPI